MGNAIRRLNMSAEDRVVMPHLSDGGQQVNEVRDESIPDAHRTRTKRIHFQGEPMEASDGIVATNESEVL
jgi:hypothetical protein